MQGLRLMKKEIPNLIRQYRFENDEMSQQALADAVGVSRQAIIAIESGKSVPSLLLAYKIAKAFDLFIEDLFLLDEMDRKPPTKRV
jgi:putative transcriptional regulator